MTTNSLIVIKQQGFGAVAVRCPKNNRLRRTGATDPGASSNRPKVRWSVAMGSTGLFGELDDRPANSLLTK